MGTDLFGNFDKFKMEEQKMKDKYNMTLEQNVFLAKRNIVDYIWKSAHLEGIDVTFPETQQIYDGGNIGRLRVDEIVTINNLKHAWQFILSTIEQKADFNYLCSINALVGSNLVENAGNLRSGDVRIGGTKWKPLLPNKNVFEENLKKLCEVENGTQRAIETMAYIMKSQLFWDGNKRSAMLFANQMMIQNGLGIITIPIEKREEFGKQLIKYYETEEIKDLEEFVYHHCIDGIEF